MIIGYIKDDLYPYGNNEKIIRKVSRGLIYNEKTEFLFHHVKASDIFGDRDVLETPGGGVDKNETYKEAFKREILEETGYKLGKITNLGVIFNEYNLINTKNINNFFLSKIECKVSLPHFVSQGDFYIKEDLFLTLDEAIFYYENNVSNSCKWNELVKRRELVILKYLKRLKDEGEISL